MIYYTTDLIIYTLDHWPPLGSHSVASDHSLVVDVAARATAQPPVEPLPRVQSLACPYPDPGRDPHYDRHQILDHENIKVRLQLLVVIYLAQILTIGVL